MAVVLAGTEMDYVSRDCIDMEDFTWDGRQSRFLVIRELHKIIANLSTSFDYLDEEVYDANVRSNIFEMCFDHYGLPIVTPLIERYWSERGVGDLPEKMYLTDS